MKTLIGYLFTILVFIGLLIPLENNRVEPKDVSFNYNFNSIKEVDLDSINKTLDSIIEFSDKNIKYLDYIVKKELNEDSIKQIRQRR